MYKDYVIGALLDQHRDEILAMHERDMSADEIASAISLDYDMDGMQSLDLVECVLAGL